MNMPKELRIGKLAAKWPPTLSVSIITIPIMIVIFWPATSSSGVTKSEAYRSPTDLALLPDNKRVLTANHTADTVSLVDFSAGKVLAELRVGRKPVAIACSPDGKRAAVSNLWSGTITLLDVGDFSLKEVGAIPVGSFPRGLAFAKDGNSIYAAIAGKDEVLQMDWHNHKMVRRWPAPREPRRLALSKDGNWLAAASSRSGELRCWNLKTGELHWERKIEDAFNLRGLGFTSDDQSVLCVHNIRREFPVSKENIEEGWVIDSRVTKLAMKPDAAPSSWQIALDIRGKAVGDPDGLALDGNGKILAIAAGGTHELLLLDAPALPWNAGDPGDFLDGDLQKKGFRRVELGGRPMAVALTKDGTQALVANYLLDAIQVVDIKKGTILRTISLGSPAKPSAARKGESLFYDARRSHNQWFSCHTCHVDGHTCCLNFDTLNDGFYGKPKMTPSLHNVTKTGPWTWHGWQKDLGAAVTHSLTKTMFGPEPTKTEVADMLAFLETLTPPPNPNRGTDGSLSPQAERGKEIFQGKAGCIRCHRGEFYTSNRNYDVGLEPDGGPYKLWNPPSLTGLYDRGPYLHDGRARSLQDLLQNHHRPQMLDGEKLTPAEQADLIAFLLSI
jgi:YVTN family beta-propeller protein